MVTQEIIILCNVTQRVLRFSANYGIPCAKHGLAASIFFYEYYVGNNVMGQCRAGSKISRNSEFHSPFLNLTKYINEFHVPVMELSTGNAHTIGLLATTDLWHSKCKTYVFLLSRERSCTDTWGVCFHHTNNISDCSRWNTQTSANTSNRTIRGGDIRVCA